MTDHRGQALIEFLATLAIVISMTYSIALLFLGFWARLNCSYTVFESVHRTLTGQLKSQKGKVHIKKYQDRIRGEATCQGIKEGVELPTLEGGQW